MFHSYRQKCHVFILCGLIIAQSFLFSGCGYMSLGRKTRFIPNTEEVTLSISEKEDGTYIAITDAKNKIKLNQYRKSYFVKQTKEGHVDKTTEINRSSANHLKRVDILTMITTDIVMTVMAGIKVQSLIEQNPAFFPDPALYTMVGLGLAGWGATMPAPGRLYSRKIELPALIPILTKDTNQLFLTSGDHEFTLRKRGVRVRDYPAMKQYKNGYGYESRDTTEVFDFVEDLELYDEVADALVELEYGVDSTKAENTTTLRVDSRIKSVVYNLTDNKLKCELKAVWGLETMDELQYLYGRSFVSQSEWLDFAEDSLNQDEQKKLIRQSLSEAIEANLQKFIALDTVQSILSSPIPIPLIDEEELELTTGAAFSSSVSEAVKAVVTVVTPDGHGSGCIITPDGYIITNAHVVDEDTTGFFAIFSDDVENEIPLELIRKNEAIDLALLKIDSTGFLPLKLGTNADMETGVDVYAIGTPADTDLGQTVTRGIISGKRKFGGHTLVQTDVGISPGNSGGALILPNGVLLGIVTSEMKSRRIDDIGFAIPAPIIEDALKIKLNE